MAEEQHRPEHEHFYDPLTAEGGGRRRKRKGVLVGVGVAIAIHGGVGYYLWKAKFEPKYKLFQDQAVNVAMLKQHKAPPPPPPPPPKNRPPPPPPPPNLPPPPPPPPNLPAPPPIPRPPPPPAPAPPAPVAHHISNPDWVRKPSEDEVAAYYPDGAQRLSEGGLAKISCTVTVAGTLSGCEVVSEDPHGLGFGDAALKMAHLFKMKPQEDNGQSVGGASVTVPIRFVPPEE